MPFHLCSLPSSKYTSFDSRKVHEYEYQKYLKSITAMEKKPQHSVNQPSKNYFTQRQMNLQYREQKRRAEYERIQKENLRFSRRLINTQTSLNRVEHQRFFDQHCKLKQHLQRYPDPFPNKSTHFLPPIRRTR